ncbi:MAG: hypothetical protein ACFFG0_33960 [Candidatus Thorarchaeota archaeon]
MLDQDNTMYNQDSKDLHNQEAIKNMKDDHPRMYLDLLYELKEHHDKMSHK